MIIVIRVLANDSWASLTSVDDEESKMLHSVEETEDEQASRDKATGGLNLFF